MRHASLLIGVSSWALSSLSGCIDAPVYSTHLHDDGRVTMPNEMQFAAADPATVRSSPLAAQLGIPTEGRPQQYFPVNAPIELWLSPSDATLDPGLGEVIWSHGDGRLRTEIRESTRDEGWEAILPTEAVKPGRWTVEVRHPALAATGSLWRHFEVLQIASAAP